MIFFFIKSHLLWPKFVQITYSGFGGYFILANFIFVDRTVEELLFEFGVVYFRLGTSKLKHLEPAKYLF